jgi:hypothetical protein
VIEMRTTRRIIAVIVVTLLLVGLAIAALAGPRAERGLTERDRDRVVEQVEADDLDEVMLRERDRDRLHARDVEDAGVRQHRDRDRIHHPEDTEARQHHDRDRERLHEECDQQEQPRAAHRRGHGGEHEPARDCDRHGR